jgi:hypothetical protein
VRAAPLDSKSWCILALAQSQELGITPGVIETIRACYAYGPREIGLINGRLMLALGAWDRLPQDIRTAAMIDVATALGNPMLAPWMAKRLAYAVTWIAPGQAPLAETLLDTYGGEFKVKYEEAVSAYRSAAGKRDVAGGGR